MFKRFSLDHLETGVSEFKTIGLKERDWRAKNFPQTVKKVSYE